MPYRFSSPWEHVYINSGGQGGQVILDLFIVSIDLYELNMSSLASIK
jgi:hypothetical protein